MTTTYYEQIKQMARDRRCKAPDLLALSYKNDPFYMGTKTDLRDAEWFAGIWRRFGYDKGIHLRRIHYQIISQEDTIRLPNGKPYENTEACWIALTKASKPARYLELVDPAAFVDRRNPDPQIFQPEKPEDCFVDVEEDDNTIAIPDLPELPGFSLAGFEGQQRYHLEIWCEKSTQNDVLVPLCRRYGANLITGVGEMSITSTLEAVSRIEKPARIFYVSDFDPAGQSMPVAVSRKIEYFVMNLDGDVDIRLFPVVLTVDQVREYSLPRTPIKESEPRRGRFEDRFGEGAVELDALEALHPGVLAHLLRDYLDRYYDDDLEDRVAAARSQTYDDLEDERSEIIGDRQEEVDAITEEFTALAAEVNGKLDDIRRRQESLWQAIRDDMDDQTPEPAFDWLPEADVAVEDLNPLYDSSRGYIDQIRKYKEFQGKA